MASQTLRAAEVERRARHVCRAPERQGFGVHRDVTVRVHPQQMVQHVTAAPIQVPVGVVGEVDGRGPGGGGPVGNGERVVVAQQIRHLHTQRTRIALLTVRADPAELHERTLLADAGDGLPQLMVEAARPAVQVVVPIIPGQLVRHAVQREAASPDTVGVAPDQRTEVGRGLSVQVGGQPDMPQRDICSFTRTPGHLHAHDHAAVIHDADHQPAAAAQGEQRHLLPLRGVTPGLDPHKPLRIQRRPLFAGGGESGAGRARTPPGHTETVMGTSSLTGASSGSR